MVRSISVRAVEIQMYSLNGTVSIVLIAHTVKALNGGMIAPMSTYKGSLLMLGFAIYIW